MGEVMHFSTLPLFRKAKIQTLNFLKLFRKY